MEEKLFIYYTSDLHSHFENLPKINGYFNQKKKLREKMNQTYWLFDNGDHVDRFHPITEASMGKANIELLNKSEYHMATIGNNEGITLDHSNLFHLYDKANFDVVCANLESTNGTKPGWLKSTSQLESESGIKIGVIGLTAPFNAFYHLLDWHIKSPLETLDEEIKELAQQNDIIVLLSHLGINEDEVIAERYPEIDVIIGGHTHHLFRSGDYVNQSLLTAAGKHGKYVGEVILTWDHSSQSLVSKEAYTTTIDDIEADAAMEERLQNYRARAINKLNQPVVTIGERLEVDWFHETKLMTMLVDTLRGWTKADIAMLNAGVILEHLEPGTVTYGDIHRICPHPINPCLVRLQGSELVEVIRQSLAVKFIEFPLKGFGFRGEVIGRMIFSGLEIDIEQNLDGADRVKKITFNGKPINMKKEYQLATADTFTFGQLLPEVARASSKKLFMPEFLRDLLVHTLKKNFN